MFGLNSVHAHLHGVVLGQVRLVRQMFGWILFRMASLAFAMCWCNSKCNRGLSYMVFGQVSAQNVWIEFCSRSFIWCYVTLGQVSSPNVLMDSVLDGVTDISDALLATQSINEDSVTWCQVRLVRQMFGLNSGHAHLHGVVLGQVRLVGQMFGWILFRMASLTLATCWWQLKHNERSVTWCQVRLG